MTRLKTNQDMDVAVIRGASVPISATYFEMRDSESVSRSVLSDSLWPLGL